MIGSLSPYVNHCSFCGNGLLRLYRCQGCEAVVVVCDECELIWSDIAAVSEDAGIAADGGFPACPVCQAETSQWNVLSGAEVLQLDLQQYVKGDSA